MVVVTMLTLMSAIAVIMIKININMICEFLFDWNSFWINIIAGLIFFVLGVLVSIWLIPRFTIRLIKKKNKKYLIVKFGAVLQEFCDFLSESPFRDKELNYERISVFTKKSDLKNYRFVALCGINVFNEIVYPKMTLVIYDFYKDRNPDDAYKLISEEYSRLKLFRFEIERILTVHSIHLDDDFVQKISNLCLDIKVLETDYKSNLLYNELLEETNSEKNGIFGLNELPKIYKNLLSLIKELISLDYFEYEIEKTK